MVNLKDWPEVLSYALMPWLTLINEAPWLKVMVQILIAFLGVMLLHRFATPVWRRIAAPFPLWRRLVDYASAPGRMIVFLLLVQVILRNNTQLLPAIPFVTHLGALALIASITWFAVRCVNAVADTVIESHPVDSPDNLQARRVHTQTKVLSRSAIVLIVLLGTGMALMTLPFLRQIGASLLAAGGLAGLVVGFAAKPVLGNLLAGMQLAVTQPIRLEDVVIVQNEWGWIEEITGTYVVVRIWDQRRLIVPLQWFIENPFQNWTRTTADIMGTVTIWVDYRMPLAPLREELDRACKESPYWDGRLAMLQVTEAGESAMQVRALVSSADAGRNWDLRCEVREKLLEFIQKNYADCLPRARSEVDAALRSNGLEESVFMPERGREAGQPDRAAN